MNQLQMKTTQLNGTNTHNNNYDIMVYSNNNNEFFFFLIDRYSNRNSNPKPIKTRIIEHL
jgi:hypothetical protein